MEGFARGAADSPILPCLQGLFRRLCLCNNLAFLPANGRFLLTTVCDQILANKVNVFSQEKPCLAKTKSE